MASRSVGATYRSIIRALGYTPANSASSGDMLAANNLSELTATASTARTNIGLVAVAASGSASDLSTGTLAAARGGAGALSGLLKGNGAGVVSAAAAGTDYLAPPSGSSLQKANSGGALANATAGTDYLAPPSGTSLLKANSGGALANATAGTDYLAPPAGTSILKGNSGGALANASAGTDYVAPGGALGTPSSGTLTNCSGYPGISWTTLATLTPSNSASSSDTTHFTSAYKVYDIELVNVIPATNNDTLVVQVTQAATAKSDAAYYSQVNRWATNTGGGTEVGSVVVGGTGTYIQLTLNTGISNAAASNGVSGTIRIYDPANATGKKHIRGHMNYLNGSHFEEDLSSGYYSTNNTAVDGFLLKYLLGNITSGTIIIRGGA